MAKREYSQYQKHLIKRYYEQRETLALQHLGEIVSDLYLCESAGKRQRLWDRAVAHLVALEVKESTWWPIVESDDVRRLAKLLTELHGRA